MTEADVMLGLAKVMLRELDVKESAVPVAVRVRGSVRSQGLTLRVTAVLLNQVTVGVSVPAKVENKADVFTPPPKWEPRMVMEVGW